MTPIEFSFHSNRVYNQSVLGGRLANFPPHPRITPANPQPPFGKIWLFDTAVNRPGIGQTLLTQYRNQVAKRQEQNIKLLLYIYTPIYRHTTTPYIPYTPIQINYRRR